MSRNIGLVALVVRDYDEAIEFYVDRLGFALVEYSPVLAQAKRWVVLAPGAPGGAQLLLARAVGEEQVARIGNQTGVRVFLFLHTDDFWRHYQTYQERGVEFVRPPRQESYGIIAVFAERRLQSRLTKGKQRLTVGSSTFSKHLTFLRAVKVNSGWNAYRSASIVVFLYCALHSYGALISTPRFGAASDAVLESMRTVKFDAQGFQDSWYGFYLGFGWLASVLFAVSAAQLWIIGGRVESLVHRRWHTSQALCCARDTFTRRHSCSPLWRSAQFYGP